MDKDTDDERLYEVEETRTEYFDVNRNTGVINCQPNVPKGVYTFRVKVADRNPESKNKAVTSTVLFVK